MTDAHNVPLGSSIDRGLNQTPRNALFYRPYEKRRGPDSLACSHDFISMKPDVYPQFFTLAFELFTYIEFWIVTPHNR
jgi:hypothetical protein